MESFLFVNMSIYNYEFPPCCFYCIKKIIVYCISVFIHFCGSAVCLGFSFLSFSFLFFDTVPPCVTLAGLEFPMQTRLPRKAKGSDYISLLNAGIKSTCHYRWWVLLVCLYLHFLAYNTLDSQAISDPSTNQALPAKLLRLDTF